LLLYLFLFRLSFNIGLYKSILRVISICRIFPCMLKVKVGVEDGVSDGPSIRLVLLMRLDNDGVWEDQVA